MKRVYPIVAGLNIALTGAFFGVLQWGAFFLLQSYLASTAIIYLLATSVWLLGSLAGLALPGRRGEAAWLATATAAYYALQWVAKANPYDLRFLPLLLLFVAAMGAYAGRFFRFRRAALGTAKWLFFIENTGFVLGMVFTVVALFWTGESLLQLAPAVGAGLCLLTALPFAGQATSGTTKS